MQLTTFLSAAATVATASALGAVTLDKNCDTSKPYARVINRCNYDVHLWSVMKSANDPGCSSAAMVTLKKGEIYNENYQTNSEDPTQGVSIKISKTQSCANHNIVQLEYFLEQSGNPAFQFNYLDVSYVDCGGQDCPTKQEGYYLVAGNQTARAVKTTSNNSWCPILSCSNAAECATMSYINPDDIQTKTCGLTDSMDFYMCGGEAPSGNDDQPASSAPAPASSYSQAAPSYQASSPASKPSTTLVPVVSSAADNYNIKVAAVTPAPKNDDAAKGPKVKTKVVYVTEYANAKRHEHAHAHARRHQPFHA